MTRSRQTADWGSRAGLAKIVPSSVAVGSGTGSASTLGTVSFSGASSVSLNDVFSTTYDNYRIMINVSSASTGAQLQMRLRVSNSDNTGATSYQRSGYRSTPGAIATSYAATSLWFIAPMSTGVSSKVVLDILDPFKTIATGGHSVNFDQPSNDSYGLNFVHIDATSFTGFSLIPSAGNITGEVSIYGYTK